MDESREIQWFRRELAQTSQMFEEKVRELLAVRRIWDSLKHTRDLPMVFEALLLVVIEETNAEYGSILLLNRETRELAVRASRGLAVSSSRYYQVPDGAQVSLRMDEKTAEWLKAQHGKPISIPDTAADNRFVATFLAAGPTGSLLCLPMIVSDEVVGLITMSHPEPHAFTPEDQQVASTLTDQAALALSSVQAFDELQRFNETLEAEVRRASEELRRTNEALLKHEEELKSLNASLEDRVRQRTLELQALYERMDGLVEHLPEGVFLLDHERRLVLINPQAREGLKELAEAGVGDRISRIGGHSLDKILTPRLDGLAHEVMVEGPIQRIFEVQARLISEGRTEGGWVIVTREVTQEREMQERAQQQDRLAAVGQLAAGVAHDFNNLLTGIVGFAELLEIRQDIPDSAKGSLRIIVSQGQRAAQLIQQILDFTRKTFVEQESVNLAPLLKEAARGLGRSLPGNIRVVTAFEDGDFIVKANPAQLRQMLLNLVSNARDAMPEGGELRIGLSRAQVLPGEPPPMPDLKPGVWAVWTVSDTGTGMSPEVIARVYEPFFTTKGTGRGSGLGLSQAYGIVKQHGGEIRAESEAGKGATFTIFLPQVAEAGGFSRKSRDEVPVGLGETILLVEDEAEVVQVVRDLLERLNYRVLTAPNGAEALEIYDAHREEIALVLTDMMMPEMSGLDLYEALKERDPGIRVLIMTGYPQGREEMQIPPGIAGRLDKPMRLMQVAQEVHRALKRTG